MAALGVRWQDSTAVQVYTTHDIYAFAMSELAQRGAARNGVDWHFNRPPVVDLEFEMDCRATLVERIA